MTTTTTIKSAPTEKVIEPSGCDRCPAAGQVLWLLASGGELVLCQHHSTASEAALRARDAVDVIYEPRTR